ncbi:hypothetical protein DESC_710035 [Desulfosarcina cetonica]|nr:hypothetical protein DESC_710035 [Desulfosarcina cetonica]
MLDPGHGFLLLPEVEKRFPLQVEDDLLVDHTVGADITATDHPGDPSGQEGIVFADEFGRAHVVQFGIDHALGGRAKDPDGSFDRRGVAVGDHPEDFLLGLADQVVAVENDTVAGAEKTIGAGLGGGHGDLGHANGHEGGNEELGQVHVGDRFGNVGGHFLPQVQATAAAGQQTDTDFHQAHIEFAVSHDFVGRADAHLAAAPQGQAIGRRHHGKAGITYFLHAQLGFLEESLDLGILTGLGQTGHVGQVAAGAEGPGHPAGLVADYHSEAIGIHIVHGLGHEIDDFAIDGVHLGVKLQAEDIVAQIHQGRRRTGLDGFSIGLETGQGDDVGADLHRLVGTGRKVIIKGLAVFQLVEAFVAGRQHGLDLLGNAESAGFHLGHGGFHADGVPGLEGTHFEIESPAHGVVDFNNRIGDLGNAVGRVDQVAGQRLPGKLSALVLAIDNRLDFFRQGFGLFGRRQAGKVGFAVFGMGQGRRIDHLADFLPLRGEVGFVEADFGFLSQHLGRDHLADEFRGDEIGAGFVLGDQVIGVLGHMRHGVQADQIGGFEHGRLGTPHGRPEERIDFGNGDAHLHHQLHGLDHALNADAVTDEIGRVLGPDNPLAQDALAEIGHEGQDLGQGLRTGDDLQEFHVTDRVEEMGAEEILLERRTPALAHLLQRNAGGIGGDDGTGLADRFDAFEQVLLDLQVFDDHLDDPVAFGQFIEIVLQVADADAIDILGLHEQCGLGHDHRVQTGLGDPIASRRVVLFLLLEVEGDDVQQQGFHAGTGQKRGNATAHHAAADDCRLPDFSDHSILLQISVA